MCYKEKRRYLVTTLLCILVLISTNLQTSVAAHMLQYPCVSDESSIINKSDLSIIETSEATLRQYDIYLYVELSTEGECFQSSTDMLAYNLYNDIFSDNQKGIVIAYSFYDQFEGYYSIKLGNDTSLDESHMRNIISDGFNKYGTESEWITSTYKDLVKYVHSVENKEIKAEEKEQRLIERESKPRTFNPFFATGAIFIVIIIAIIATINHLKNRITIENQKDEISDKQKQIDDMNDGFIALSNALRVILDLAKKEQSQRESQYEPLQIEEKGTDRIAQEFSGKYQQLLDIKAEASNFYKLKDALDEFNALPPESQSSISIDISKIETLYKKSAIEYSKQIEDLILLNCTQYENTPDYFKHLGTEIEICTKKSPAYIKELVFNDILNKVKP